MLLRPTNQVKLLLFLFYFNSHSIFPQTLQQVFSEFKNDPIFKNASIGLVVDNLESNKTIFQYQSNLSITPASTLKMVTTATALELLGANFKYKTSFYISSQIENSICEGNLCIESWNDPTFLSPRFDVSINSLADSLVKHLIKYKITQIKGNLVISMPTKPINPLPDFWIWSDMGNYFGAGLYGLNFNENLYKLHLKPSSLGLRPSIISTDPVIDSLSFTNQLKCIDTNSGDNAIIYGAPYQNNCLLTGTIPCCKKQFTIKGAILNPPLVFGTQLKKILQQKGIILKGEIEFGSFDKSKFQLLYEHKSPSLKEIIKQTNLKSINLFAEGLLYSLVQHSHSQTESIDKLMSFWKQKGISIQGVFMTDGSGLSPSNAVTPLFMNSILKKMHKSSLFSSFYASFPIAGVSGTLHSLCKNTQAENNLRAKSGNINRVTAYTGYVKNHKGALLAFTFMVSNFANENSLVIKKMEKVLIKLTSEN